MIYLCIFSLVFKLCEQFIVLGSRILNILIVHFSQFMDSHVCAEVATKRLYIFPKLYLCALICYNALLNCPISVICIVFFVNLFYI